MLDRDAQGPPYAEYMKAFRGQIDRDIENAPAMTSEFHGCSPGIRDAVVDQVNHLATTLVGYSHELHADPEIAFEEHRAVGRTVELLTSQGIEVQTGSFGLDTAFHARAGEGQYRVAFLAEYDALPGLGHACGHNVIAATAVGAFLALASQIERFDGTVELFGCPAEEGGAGKEYLADAGAFDGVDVALMLHPFGADAAVHPWLGVRSVNVTYHGIAAHAAMSPYLGRNALDGVVSAYNGISQLRQHILPSDRIHGVIKNGGDVPNIVPSVAEANFFLRSRTLEGLDELANRSSSIFAAAATSSGTTVEVEWDPNPMYFPVRNNVTLAARYAENAQLVGRKVLGQGVYPGEITGSTDLGNVSVRLPAIHPLLAIAPPDVSIHSEEFAECAAGPEADKGCVDGATGLALTGADYLSSPRLREAVNAEFMRSGGVVDVVEHRNRRH